jgi:RimJ/RimL family protein N-acetyltransferase
MLLCAPWHRPEDVLQVCFQTERMLVRRLTPTDAVHLHALDGDPEVMRFLTGGKPTPYERVTDELLPRLLDEYLLHPTRGRWAAVDRADGAFLGWFALAPGRPGAGAEAELGYRLRRSAWGRGLATEGARALVRAAFTELGVQRVYAETMVVNAASRRVLERAGLTQTRVFHVHWDEPIPGSELGEVEYALLEADWRRREAG